jgi:hypothetical protein
MPVSHWVAPMVQRDMIHSLKTALVILPSAALLSVLSACGPQIDVLHDTDTGVATGGTTMTTGDGTAATGGAAAQGGANNAPTTGGSAGASICSALSPASLDAVIPDQACSDSNICDPGGCVSTATNNFAAAALATCRDGQAQVITMTAIDVPANGLWTPRNDGISWTTCDAALASGLTGQACTFPGKSCVTTTSDTCCIEGVQCAVAGGTSGLLERVRVCSPQCTNLKTDTTVPAVTDCASAMAADMCHKTAPCSGNFVCWGMLGSDLPIAQYAETDSLNGAIWCAGGALVGGYGYAWGV